MTIRRSDMALTVLAGAGLFTIAAVLHAGFSAGAAKPQLEARAALVRALGLTDLALFTEARYTRHPSQADLHSAFQDHPMSLDHFPTGSLIAPPRSFGPTGGFAPPGRKVQP